MNKTRRPAKFLASLLTVLLLSACMVASQPETQPQAVFDPVGLLLSWRNDPTTTITIDWHVTPEDAPRLPGIEYRRADSNDDWTHAPGSTHPFPLTKRTIYRTELFGLQPATRYQFRFGEQTRSYWFQTLPEQLSRPLRFAVGGDTGSGPEFEQIARVARAHNPDFIVIGGDFAYADAGRRDYAEGVSPGESRRRWEQWFDIAKRQFVTVDDRVIPVLAAIGNHEVWGGYHHRHPEYQQNDLWRQHIAQVFYQVFPFVGQPGYGVLDIGDYLSLVLLDTEHSNPIAGRQTAWLQQVLSERSAQRRVFPVYHVPGYPSIRPYEDHTQTLVREHWVPLFEAHNLQLAFEHHDHIYKRSEPIRAGKPDPSGVTYLGDGSFGLVRRNRPAHNPADTWYLHTNAIERHFILVELTPEHTRVHAINDRNEIFDELLLPVPALARRQP